MDATVGSSLQPIPQPLASDTSVVLGGGWILLLLFGGRGVVGGFFCLFGGFWVFLGFWGFVCVCCF